MFSLSLRSGGGPGRRCRIIATVAAVTVVLALSSVGLLLVLASRSFAPLAIEAQALYPLSPVLIVADLALTALFIIIGWRLRSMIIAAAAALNLALTVLLGAWTGFSESDPAMLIDNLALIMALITSLVGSVIAIYSFRYMREDPRQPRFFAVTLLFLGGMNAAVFSNDLLWLFLFWDVTTLCSFLLIAHDGTMEARDAARRALAITLGGATAFIIGAVLALEQYGTLSISDFPVAGLGGLALLPLSLLAIAAFTKSAQLPFQSWLLRAMVAPTSYRRCSTAPRWSTSGSTFCLGYRRASSMRQPLAGRLDQRGHLLASNILAMTQRNAKRVLAWSTIGNLGLVAMCVGISTSLAIAARVILLLYHSISKALLFCPWARPRKALEARTSKPWRACGPRCRSYPRPFSSASSPSSCRRSGCSPPSGSSAPRR